MRRLNSEQVGALAVTIAGDGGPRPDRADALTQLIKAVSFEEDAVARLNVYAEALDAVAEADDFGTLGLVVNGRTVRVRRAKGVAQ